jgi:hypothetical protein
MGGVWMSGVDRNEKVVMTGEQTVKTGIKTSSLDAKDDSIATTTITSVF